MRYFVTVDMVYAHGGLPTRYFDTRKDALMYAYRMAKNFNWEIKVGVSGNPYYQGQVVGIKGKRFYALFSKTKDGTYSREYVLHADGTLGE